LALRKDGDRKIIKREEEKEGKMHLNKSTGGNETDKNGLARAG